MQIGVVKTPHYAFMVVFSYSIHTFMHEVHSFTHKLSSQVTSDRFLYYYFRYLICFDRIDIKIEGEIRSESKY